MLQESKERRGFFTKNKKPLLLLFFLYITALILILHTSECSSFSLVQTTDLTRFKTQKNELTARSLRKNIDTMLELRSNIHPKKSADIGTFMPKRRFLLFSNLGDRSAEAVNSWLGIQEGTTNSRLFDVVFYYFDPEFPAPEVCPGDFCLNREGFKWPALYHFITQSGLNLNSYDAVFAVDDDISMSLEEINEMFTMFMEYKLVFAQPSYNGEISDLHFPRIQRWRGNTVVRYTNFVENAAMVIHFPTLISKLMPIMKQSISGWGIDYCFFHTSGADIHEIATIHTVKAVHPPATKVTRASQAYSEGNMENLHLNKYGAIVGDKESVNRLEGEQLMRDCGAMMYMPKVFYRVKPGEDREEVIERELPNYPEYKAFNLVKSKW